MRFTLLLLLLCVPAFAAPVSFDKHIRPILTASCTSCHQPGKLKGGLDLTTYAALAKGGKNGPILIAGNPVRSPLVTQIIGDKPEMPAKGDPLGRAEIDLISRWIEQGAKDDSKTVSVGATEPGPTPLAAPPTYSSPPAIHAVAASPDGQFIAVAGLYEILLHKSDGSAIAARLVGGSPRILKLAFSPDGTRLAAAGGAPSQFGHIQIWDIKSQKLTGSWKYSTDTLFGLAWSTDGAKLAFGCADRSARVITATTGEQLLRLDQHTDWCTAAVFSIDDARLLTASRDQSMKLTTLAGAKYIDDINTPAEPILCFARHPKEDVILCGGANGMSRLYKIAENPPQAGEKKDTNRVKEFERQPGTVHSIAYNAAGTHVVITNDTDARIHDAKSGQKTATLPHDCPVYSAAFSADGTQVFTGAQDGVLRVFDAKTGKIIRAATAVPLTAK